MFRKFIEDILETGREGDTGKNVNFVYRVSEALFRYLPWRLIVVGSLAENVGEGGDSSGREFGEEGLRKGLGGSR
jgi:hypothetical protein